jgi:hypothetical protein
MDAMLARAARASSRELYKKISWKNTNVKMVTMAVKSHWNPEQNVRLVG